LDHIRRHINPVHTLPFFFFNIHFNIIVLSTSRSSMRSYPFWNSDQNFVRISNLCHATYVLHALLSHPLNFTFCYLMALSASRLYTVDSSPWSDHPPSSTHSVLYCTVLLYFDMNWNS
jgi:hypothetical protein